MRSCYRGLYWVNEKGNRVLKGVDEGTRRKGIPLSRSPSVGYWTVMPSDPLAQVLPVNIEALIVAVPALTNVASPLVLVEKVSTDVSLEVHVAEPVTSELLSAAVNCCVVP